MYVRRRGRERVVKYLTQVASFICTQADGLAHRNKLASFFFQNDEIFIQLDELDKFGQNHPKKPSNTHIFVLQIVKNPV